ncbi:MAG TPA: HPr family phosphocarrier protein [Thiobacillaceae bacterium]|nr:HPr family phosphocarrier protein [Thiobacillaceae bacterium]
MQQRDVEIVNKLGLHARPSARITQLASTFKSRVFLARNGRRVNAKSIMGVMMLAAARGTTVTLETDGEDEEAAMEALSELITSGFGEAAE